MAERIRRHGRDPCCWLPGAAGGIIRSMKNFGKGPTLKEASPRLRDTAARIERILTVTEVNSVAEGLPPFGEETRERLRTRLSQLSSPAPKPTE